MTSSNNFKFTPIGGVGQIGSNITLVEYENSSLLIDAGILFPYENFFDINYLIPNLDAITTTPEKIIITHGHEDHIGAIRHVVSKFPNMEVYAPPLAAELIEKKLRDARLERKIFRFTESSVLTLGRLVIHPIHVNHSIPETFGLHFTCPKSKSSVFFISDFKIDSKSPYERPFDFEKLKMLSKSSNKKVLFCDSTNILSKNLTTPSEVDLLPDLEQLLSRDGRVFATFFASNIHRLQSFINLASITNRKCVLHGGSLLKYSSIALELGLLADPDNRLREVDTIDIDDPSLLVLLSGCQGDFRSSFRRVCMGEDTRFKLNTTDTLILSSKAIPGNEKNISMLLNKATESGCFIATADDFRIHASGHPGREDIKLLIDTYSPHLMIPIHGETQFLHKHIEFLHNNFPKLETALLYNFDTLDIFTGLVSKGQPYDPILIHGDGLPIERSAISERRKIACNGAVFVSLPDKDPTRMFITFQGLPASAEPHKEILKNVLIDRCQKKSSNLSEDLRIAVRQFFLPHLGYRPMAIIHIH